MRQRVTEARATFAGLLSKLGLTLFGLGGVCARAQLALGGLQFVGRTRGPGDRGDLLLYLVVAASEARFALTDVVIVAGLLCRRALQKLDELRQEGRTGIAGGRHAGRGKRVDLHGRTYGALLPSAVPDVRA